jgi:chromosome segregation ATPase
MSLLNLFEKWIGEHGSAASLRDHNALLKAQKEDLSSQISALNLKIKSLELERDNLNTLLKNCKTQGDRLRDEVQKLEGVRVSLKDQVELEGRINQLEYTNRDLERQLRIRSIGF